MSIDNDDVFSFILDEEFNKIPFIFRFSKRRIKIGLGIMGAGFAAMCILSTAVNWIDGATAIIAAAAFTAIVAGWMSIAVRFEKRAFSNASSLAYRYRIAEQERSFYRCQNYKLLNKY